MTVLTEREATSRGWKMVRSAGLLVLLGWTGCGGETGPPRVQVSGAVTYAGKPVPAGEIQYIPTGGTTGPAALVMIKEGKYKTEPGTGPVAGSHKVLITGSDGVPHPNSPTGITLFSGYETTAELKAGEQTQDFAIPEKK